MARPRLAEFEIQKQTSRLTVFCFPVATSIVRPGASTNLSIVARQISQRSADREIYSASAYIAYLFLSPFCYFALFKAETLVNFPPVWPFHVSKLFSSNISLFHFFFLPFFFNLQHSFSIHYFLETKLLNLNIFSLHIFSFHFCIVCEIILQLIICWKRNLVKFD